MGEVWRLELPLNSKIHPVLHVSQLKKQIPRDTIVLEDLSSVCTKPTKAIQPERSLGKRLIQRGAQTMATWEDEGDIEYNFGFSLRTSLFISGGECNDRQAMSH
jgi:hypothetical protein